MHPPHTHTPPFQTTRYCECFASGRYCDACNCINCFNNKDNEATRQQAVETILERNPNAFRPKIQVRLFAVLVLAVLLVFFGARQHLVMRACCRIAHRSLRMF